MADNKKKQHYNEDGELLCPRCQRVVVGWPIRRPDTCSAKDWSRCIRDRDAVQRDWRNRSRGLTETGDRFREFFSMLQEAMAMSYAQAVKTLGLPPAFTADQVKTAYREKSREHHPDRGGSTEMMQQINLAYEALKNKSSGTTINYEDIKAKDAAFAKVAKDALLAHFKPEVFARHFTSVFGEPFTFRVVTDMATGFGSVSYSVEFRNADKTTIIDVLFSVDFTELHHGKFLQTPDSGLHMVIATSILNNRKKVKLGQSNYRFDRSYQVLSDPSVLFPAAKLRTQPQKDQARPLSKRDVYLVFQKELGARVGNDGWVWVSVGDFTVGLWRSTILRAAGWSINGVYGKTHRREAMTKIGTFLEKDDEMHMLWDALKALQMHPPTTAQQIESHLNDVIDDHKRKYGF